VKAKELVQYALVTPREIDADPVSFDNKPVEIGITKDDYDAYSVVTVGDPTRTRAIIIRLDTATSMLLKHTNPSGKLRIRGTARVSGNPSALSIGVDSAEALEN
jgi:hypothetical protein